MSSPLPSNMAMTTVRGRYGQWNADQFVPFVGMQVRFAPAYPFVTNVTATPAPLVIATAPRTLQTDADGYLSDPDAGFDSSGMGLNRNAKIVSSDDPDIEPHDWPYLVTFHGPGATNFRAFRTPLPSDATVDISILTPQRVAPGTAPTQAEIAAANAAASAADAQAIVSTVRRGQAGGVAALDVDGDVNNAAGQKVLPGGGGGTPDLSGITGMSVIGKQLVATQISGQAASATLMRGVIGAGTGNSNLTIGTIAGTAPDAQVTNTAIGQRAMDNTVVHKTGDETVDGVKQFLQPQVIVPATSDTNPATLAQANAAATSAAASRIPLTQKSVAGGVAALDVDGDVVNAAGVKVTGTGGGSISGVTLGTTGTALVQTTTPAAARAVIQLDLVTNTAPENMPVSVPQQIALNSKANAVDLAAGLTTKVDASTIGAASGVASLDPASHLPYTQLPLGALLCIMQNPDSTWPTRYVATNRVMWVGSGTAPPAGGGTTTSGTGMVENYDFLMLGVLS